MRRQLREGLRVGQDGARGVAQEGGVPDAQQAHHDRQVVAEGRRPEVLVNVMSPCTKKGYTVAVIVVRFLGSSYARCATFLVEHPGASHGACK